MTVDWEAVIGLEVHVQLGTRSKLFCACPVDFGGQPSSRICPVCTAQPGALPVLNRKALELAVRAGLALGCSIRQRTVFDRKNYFYPDLPKGYQISQYDEPVAEHGRVLLELPDGTQREAGIRRVHVEEDAGKTTHPEGSPHSLVDLNRAGVPLVEIVGEADLRSPEEAAAYLTTLRRTLRHAGVSECDMEKGSLRCDANVSLRPQGESSLGTKVEIKNMNSIRNVERALAGEIQRQRRLLEEGRGDEIVQETRGFRDADGSTVTLRRKEEADDYRYFPDPDLPPFPLPGELVHRIRESLPESHASRRRRYREALGLSPYDAAVLAEDPAIAGWFDACLGAGVAAKTAANWTQGELLAFLSDTGRQVQDLRTTPADLAELVRWIDAGRLSHQAAKRVFREMLEHGVDVETAASALDLLQIQDEERLRQVVEEVLGSRKQVVQDYLGGKQAAFNALLGAVMKELRGKGDPAAIRRLLTERLK